MSSPAHADLDRLAPVFQGDPRPLGLGMDTTEDGQLVGSSGLPQPRLFAIGPAARGALWEVTAVPDIRTEARRLGQVLARISTAREADTVA